MVQCQRPRARAQRRIFHEQCTSIDWASVLRACRPEAPRCVVWPRSTTRAAQSSLANALALATAAACRLLITATIATDVVSALGSLSEEPEPTTGGGRQTTTGPLRRATSTWRPLSLGLLLMCCLLWPLANGACVSSYVANFSELTGADPDCDEIIVMSDITFTEELTITVAWSISSSTGKTLSGGGSTRLATISNRGTLSLSSLTLSGGSVS